MAKLRAPGPHASKDEHDAYRARVKAMVDGSYDGLAAIPDHKRETDPYISAQLVALRKMIDDSYDPVTGKYANQGVIEFLFTVMNDGAAALDARMKAATTLISFFHKKVPSTLMVAQQTNLADVDLSGLAPAELDAIEALLLKAQTKTLTATSVALEQQSTKH